MGRRGRTDKLWQEMLGSQGQQTWKSIQDIKPFYKERITCDGMWPAFEFGMAGWANKQVRLGTGFDGAGLAGKVFSAVVGSAAPEYFVHHVWSSEPNGVYRAFLRQMVMEITCYMTWKTGPRAMFWMTMGIGYQSKMRLWMLPFGGLIEETTPTTTTTTTTTTNTSIWQGNWHVHFQPILALSPAPSSTGS
jgi:hypothetical protein